MKTIFYSLALLCCTFTAFAADYWEKIATGSNKNLLQVSFGNKLIGYIGGTDSTLLKTTNGGVSWSVVKFSGMKFSGFTPDIVDVNFVDANNGYAIVGNAQNPELKGILYKTTDGGLSWTLSSSDMACLRSFFFDAANGFLLGSNIFSGRNVARLKTGAWEMPKALSAGSGNFLRAADFFTNTIGLVGGDGGFVYRTFDGGISYDTVKTIIDTTINALIYLNEDTILAATSNIGAALIISKDKGKTWDYDGFSPTFHYPEMRAVVGSEKDSLIIVGKSTTTGMGIIYYFGSTFMNVDNAEQALNDVGMRDDSVAFIVGDSGLVLTNQHISTGIITPKSDDIEARIYPNPADKELIIEMPYNGSFEISIVDLLGKIVIKSSEKNGKVKLQTAKLPPGQYILRVQDEHGNQMNRKLMINR